MEQQSAPVSTMPRKEQFVDQLKQAVKDPIHVRIIDAYRGSLSVQAMEVELGAALIEILEHED